jgi:hypothetical protein
MPACPQANGEVPDPEDPGDPYDPRRRVVAERDEDAGEQEQSGIIRHILVHMIGGLDQERRAVAP